MSKKQQEGGSQRPAKWIKFIGVKTEYWKKVLDQITIDKIPFEFVGELRFHLNSGKIYVQSTIDLEQPKVEEIIERITESNSDLNAIEFVVDLDRIHAVTVEQVKALLEGSKDD